VKGGVDVTHWGSRFAALLALILTLAAVVTASAFAWENEPGCNSGRGNGSEGSSAQLLVPGTDTGPGTFPTVDCDPGSSGDVNRGGD
jgi:hypothetical protein